MVKTSQPAGKFLINPCYKMHGGCCNKDLFFFSLWFIWKSILCNIVVNIPLIHVYLNHITLLTSVVCSGHAFCRLINAGKWLGRYWLHLIANIFLRIQLCMYGAKCMLGHSFQQSSLHYIRVYKNSPAWKICPLSCTREMDLWWFRHAFLKAKGLLLGEAAVTKSLLC